MRNNPLSRLSARKSIRAHMLWSFVASFFVAFGASVAVPNVPEIPGRIVYNIFMSFGTFSLVFILTFFFLTRRTIGYLLRLSQGLEAIAGGDLGYRFPSVREDELGRIAGNINAMAEKLELQIEKERRSEQSKMELITGVSHDLRTPLTSMIGYLELLKGKAYRDESEYERFVGNAYNKVLQLKELIDDLFEYTRLTSHDAKLRLMTVDLNELLGQIETEFHPLARKRGISVETSFPRTPLPMEIDPDKIRRAIDNLLMNALKFSLKPGVIRISLAAREGEGRPMAEIRIENDGRPISREQEERLFERFYKADDSRESSSARGGAGLGLSIARSIARLHGGDIRLSHADGHYVFRIELPAGGRSSAGEKEAGGAVR